MSEHSPGSAVPLHKARVAALTAVIVGVLLLAAAAFTLSYAGIHEIALAAGVSAPLARFYPAIFDAMLVIAGAAALALRGAGWWTRIYVWLSLLVLLAAVAAADAAQAIHLALPKQPSRAAVAVTPWVLLLLGFGFWLAMLHHMRRLRRAGGGRGAAAVAGEGEQAPPGGVTWAGRAGQSRPGTPGPLDALLEPRSGAAATGRPVGEGEPFIVDEDLGAQAGGTGSLGAEAVGTEQVVGKGDRAPGAMAEPSASPPPLDRLRSTPTPPRPANDPIRPKPAPSPPAEDPAAPGSSATAPGSAAPAPGSAATAPGSAATAPGSSAAADPAEGGLPGDGEAAGPAPDPVAPPRPTPPQD